MAGRAFAKMMVYSLPDRAWARNIRAGCVTIVTDKTTRYLTAGYSGTKGSAEGSTCLVAVKAYSFMMILSGSGLHYRVAFSTKWCA
jgi:hypothetical protein